MLSDGGQRHRLRQGKPFGPMDLPHLVQHLIVEAIHIVLVDALPAPVPVLQEGRAVPNGKELQLLSVQPDKDPRGGGIILRLSQIPQLGIILPHPGDHGIDRRGNVQSRLHRRPVERQEAAGEPHRVVFGAHQAGGAVQQRGKAGPVGNGVLIPQSAGERKLLQHTDPVHPLASFTLSGSAAISFRTASSSPSK